MFLEEVVGVGIHECLDSLKDFLVLLCCESIEARVVLLGVPEYSLFVSDIKEMDNELHPPSAWK